MKNVCVLMSTYNGEKYLLKQLESIAKQQGDFHIQYYIRDDGSTDGTVDIIHRWCEYHDAVMFGQSNIGVRDSFLWLIQHAPAADYYAFADQDDLWVNNKLQRAIVALSPCKKPAVYYSNLCLIDAKDAILLERQYKRSPNLTFENSFVRNWAPGCAQVWNAALMDELLKYHLCKLPMHDLATIRLAGAFGDIVYDAQPTVFYRQHANNVAARRGGIYKRLKQHWHCWAHADGCPLEEQALELLQKAGSALSPAQIELLKIISSYRHHLSSWWFLVSGKLATFGGLRTNLSFRIKCFLRIA